MVRTGTVSDVRIYLSYARDDDKPPNVPNGVGFVSFLQAQLSHALQQLEGTAPTIWRDASHLPQNRSWQPEIKRAIEESQFFLVVLSTAWLSRPDSLRALETFARRHAAGADGVRIRERIVVVTREFVDAHMRPPLLQNTASFNFFQADADRERPFFADGQVVDPRFHEQVDALAKHLWRATQHLGASPAVQAPVASAVPELSPSPPRRSPVRGGTVFVAKPASGMERSYEHLVRALSDRGYTVVPPPALDMSHGPSAAAVIDQALAQAAISIHLLREIPGYPGQRQSPITALQLERAARAIRASGSATGLQRVIWVPEFRGAGTTPEIDRLLGTDEFIGGDFEQFVGLLLGYLESRDLRSEERSDDAAGATAADQEPTDVVDVSAYAPESGRAGEKVLVQIYLHRREDAATARGRAVKADATAAERDVETLDLPLKRGQRVGVVLEAEDLVIDEPSQHFTWNGETRAAKFFVSLPLAAAGRTVAIRAHVLIGHVPVGAVRFTLPIVSRDAAADRSVQRRGEEAPRYNYAFLSYSRADEARILEYVQLMQGLGQDFFHDIVSLAPGDKWRERLEQAIDKCDLFLLFLTDNSAKSAEVEKETTYALARRSRSGEPFVWFVFLEPQAREIPPWLADYHADSILRRAQAAGARGRYGPASG
jgi:hypothetical protein